MQRLPSRAVLDVCRSTLVCRPSRRCSRRCSRCLHQLVRVTEETNFSYRVKTKVVFTQVWTAAHPSQASAVRCRHIPVRKLRRRCETRILQRCSGQIVLSTRKESKLLVSVASIYKRNARASISRRSWVGSRVVQKLPSRPLGQGFEYHCVKRQFLAV